MSRGIVIICCGPKTISVVVDTSKPITLDAAEIKAEFDCMVDPIQWQYPVKEENTIEELKRLFFHFMGISIGTRVTTLKEYTELLIGI